MTTAIIAARSATTLTISRRTEMRTINWQVFGTAEVEPDFDAEDFVDELYGRVQFMDGVSVDGVDWED